MIIVVHFHRKDMTYCICILDNCITICQEGVSMNIILYFSSFIYGFFNVNLFIYFFYLLLLIKTLIVIFKSDDISEDNFSLLIDLLIYSIILPDNYVVVFITGLIWILILYKCSNSKKMMLNLLKNKLFLLCISLLIITTLVNGISLTKILFFLLYNLPYILLLSLIPIFRYRIFKFDNSAIKISLIAQFIAIISFIVSNYSYILSQADHDWLTGTFGPFQSNILLFFSIFSGMYFVQKFIKDKNPELVIYIIISFIIAFLTTSTALIILFFVAFALIMILVGNHKYRKQILLSLIVGILIFFLFSPSWIIKDVMNLTDLNYAKARIGKLETYEKTFLNMQNDPLKYLIGTGIGNYSSRTALICTGEYIETYNSFFKPEISKYTADNILPRFHYVYENRLGSMDTPYSSIISIKGEFGLFGIILLFVYFYFYIKNKDALQSVIILFFFFSLFLENYIEFTKVINYLLLIVFLMDIPKLKYNDETKEELTDFTFGVLMYNQESLVNETLESIKYQVQNYGRNKKIYLILADDCSADNTLSVAKKWTRKNKELFQEITVLENKENLGTVINFNKIISLSKSNNIKVIAGDDIFSKTNYFKIYTRIDERTIGTSFPIYLIDNQLSYSKKLARRYYWRQNTNANQSKQLFKIMIGGYINTPSTFYKRSLYIKSKCDIHNSQYRLFEDDPSYYAIMKKKGNQIYFFDDFTVLYRIHSQATSTVNVNSTFYQELICFKKQYIKEESNILKKLYIFLKFQILNKWVNPIVYIEKIQDIFLFIMLSLNPFYKDFQKKIEITIQENQNYYQKIVFKTKEEVKNASR